jgi:hypothetical protein
MVSIEPRVSRSVLGVVMARQRHSNWMPVIVSNRGDQTEGQTKVSKADDWRPACSVSHVRYFDDGLPEDTTKILDQKIQRRADLRFAIGVALVLALPAFIALGVYVAAEFLLRRAS